MAKPQHLDILKQGVEVWNRWRKENPETPPDLSHAILFGANLSKADLRMAKLGGVKLRGANLSGANLRGADLVEADLIGVDLSGAKLREANLHGAFLVAVKLDGADLSTARGLSQPQINAARGDKDTKLPEEFQRPPSWLNEPQVG